MKVVSINSCNLGSTGNIMIGISETIAMNNYEPIMCYPKSRDNMKKQKAEDIIIGTRLTRNLHLRLATLSGFNGFFSYFSTMNFLRKLDEIKPDVIHLHNLHGWYINLPLLFQYIKKHDIKIIWTLHDCWSFTGHCPHFDLVGCDKWKKGCYECPSFREYPKTLVDNTKTMWKLKRKWFTNIDNMTIVTPSGWLADLAKQSYLKEYPIRVIHNGIDLDIFYPRESSFNDNYHCESRYLILGVAFDWGKRKGLDVFVELASRLSEQYQIVLVGTNDSIDKQLPNNIILIHRTQNQDELADIYSIADLFVNPTREEVFGLVNIEALACGTPVVTFDSGGSPECIDETCGSVVPKDDVDALEREIVRICETKPYSKEACLKRAKQFDMHERFQEYIELYEEIANDRVTEDRV